MFRTHFVAVILLFLGNFALPAIASAHSADAARELQAVPGLILSNGEGAAAAVSAASIETATAASSGDVGNLDRIFFSRAQRDPGSCPNEKDGACCTTHCLTGPALTPEAPPVGVEAKLAIQSAAPVLRREYSVPESLLRPPRD